MNKHNCSFLSIDELLGAHVSRRLLLLLFLLGHALDDLIKQLREELEELLRILSLLIALVNKVELALLNKGLLNLREFALDLADYEPRLSQELLRLQAVVVHRGAS